MSSKSRRPVLFRVVLAVSVVAGVLIVQGAPAMADDPVSDLGFTYSASPTGSVGDPWTAGSNATLTATVTNYGPDAAPDNTVTIGIPGGTDYVSDDGGCTGTGVLTCAGGSLANGDSRTINVIIKVHSDIAQGGNLGPLNAYVQTTGSEGTDDNSNAGTIQNAYAHRIANLAIVKAGPDGINPDLVVAGDDNGYDYTITVSTAGPSDTGYLVHDTLADGLTFDSSDAGCSAVGQDVTCGGTITAGDSPQTITIHVLVDPSVADGTILDNDATVDVPSDGTTDPDLTNNTTAGDSTVSTTITAQADLGLSVVATGGQNVAGASAGIDFVYTVSTDGPSDNVGGFKVTDALPAGFVFKSSGSSPACSASGQDITCTDTNGFPDGAVDRTFTVHAHINSSVGADDYSDLATVTSLGTQDPDSANDSDSGTVTVITQADLSLTTAAVTYPTGQTAAFANTDSTKNFAIYEYDVKNNGPSDAQNVSFNDSLPAGLTLVGACVGSSCTNFSSLPLSIGTLNGNDGTPTKESRHIRVKVTANANLRNGALTKTDNASVTSDTTDPGPSSNTASENAIVWTVPSTPLNLFAAPGNTNALFKWGPPTNFGGVPGGTGSLLDFRVRVYTSPTAASPIERTLTVAPDNCGTPGNTFYCVLIGTAPNGPALSNGTTYYFTVEARNVVGLSDPNTTRPSALPTIDASAQQITAGQLSQHTGNSTLPTSTDKQISFQDFPSNTTGVGTILETNTGSNLFCGGPCFGQIVQTKLQDPSLPGIYTLTLLYDKTLIGGTGVKYGVYYAPNTTSTTGTLLKTCPANITPAVVPCAIVKLGNKGANPALKLIVYTKDADPTTGGRTLK